MTLQDSKRNFSIQNFGLLILFSPRISESLLKIEKATAVNEVMVASAVSVAHSAPDDDQSSQTDEGFVEPKHHFFKKKVTYEVSNNTIPVYSETSN